MPVEMHAESEPSYHVPNEERLDRAGIEGLERRKLAAMLGDVRAGNAFYRQKFDGIAFDPVHDPIHKLPFTVRAELEQDQVEHPPYGTNLTYPLDRYCRYHQTSGSGGGRPM